MSIRFLTLFAAGAALAPPLAALADTVACVADATSFQTALTNAQGSTSTTFIEVARGAYDILYGTALTFDSAAATQGQLDVTGGYSSDCSTQIQDPALTVLDAHGYSAVMSLTSQAGISVRYLTLQHGANAIDGVAGGLLVRSMEGPVIVNYNIVINNYSPTDGGLLATIEDAAATNVMRVNGNLIANNLAANLCGAGGTVNHGTGSNDLINNTIAFNSSQDTDLAGGFCPSIGSVVGNNIAWGNSTYDLVSGGTFVDNDCGTVEDEPDECSNDGNLNLDPLFATPTDFRLSPSSPLLGQGSLMPDTFDSPPNYGLPTIDIKGYPRTFNNLVDMGAYERGNEIFVGDFDH